MISTIVGVPRVHRIANTYASKYNVMILEWDRESRLPKYEYRDGVEIHRFMLKAPYGLKLIFKLPIWIMYLIIFSLNIHIFSLERIHVYSSRIISTIFI